MRDASYGGFKFWLLISDDYTDYCWTIFLKTMDELRSKMIALLTDLQIASANVKII